MENVLVFVVLFQYGVMARPSPSGVDDLGMNNGIPERSGRMTGPAIDREKEAKYYYMNNIPAAGLYIFFMNYMQYI
ncbi:MAG: hypothetical protein MI975_00225 [Cytophagales bacterium]|nr:hypothetical protein [Cytophagales bacterium]